MWAPDPNVGIPMGNPEKKKQRVHWTRGTPNCPLNLDFTSFVLRRFLGRVWYGIVVAAFFWSLNCFSRRSPDMENKKGPHWHWISFLKQRYVKGSKGMQKFPKFYLNPRRKWWNCVMSFKDFTNQQKTNPPQIAGVVNKLKNRISLRHRIHQLTGISIGSAITKDIKRHNYQVNTHRNSLTTILLILP